MRTAKYVALSALALITIATVPSASAFQTSLAPASNPLPGYVLLYLVTIIAAIFIIVLRQLIRISWYSKYKLTR